MVQAHFRHSPQIKFESPGWLGKDVGERKTTNIKLGCAVVAEHLSVVEVRLKCASGMLKNTFTRPTRQRH